MSLLSRVIPLLPCAAGSTRAQQAFEAAAVRAVVDRSMARSAASADMGALLAARARHEDRTMAHVERCAVDLRGADASVGCWHPDSADHVCAQQQVGALRRAREAGGSRRA